MSDQSDPQQMDCLLKSAGLVLSSDRIHQLIPAAKRLKAAAAWVDRHDLEWGEPAFVFDPQEDPR
ncbi:MAG TPA: hypothetical protein VHD76_13180 [Bryobacteraceae bacterium]|jgi:hypothetical protein|nr:hypothetical protein [Bryobacteraceae bacterium]HWB96516.1 hypothetical protein [Bryobacteraceae bacterium]